MGGNGTRGKTPQSRSTPPPAQPGPGPECSDPALSAAGTLTWVCVCSRSNAAQGLSSPSERVVGPLPLLSTNLQRLPRPDANLVGQMLQEQSFSEPLPLWKRLLRNGLSRRRRTGSLPVWLGRQAVCSSQEERAGLGTERFINKTFSNNTVSTACGQALY